MASDLPEVPTAPDSNSEVERIKDRIHQILIRKLEDRPAVLMSELGSLLGQTDLFNLKLATRGTLGQFVKSRMSDLYRVMPVSGHNAVFMIVPAGDTQQNYDNITLEDIRPPQLRFSSFPRYNSAFWAAFAKPFESGRRFINIDTFIFSDLLSSKPEGDEWREIDQSSVPPADADDRTTLIGRSIEVWLTRNQLLAERFLASDGRERSLHGRTILHEVLSVLSEEQKRQLTLRMDIVESLLTVARNG